MVLPDIGTRQALVLNLLSDSEEKSGRELRNGLEEIEGASKSRVSFYQLMGRLEDAGLVRGRVSQEGESASVGVRRGPIPEKRYRITGDGVAVLEEYREFCRH